MTSKKGNNEALYKQERTLTNDLYLAWNCKFSCNISAMTQQDYTIAVITLDKR